MPSRETVKANEHGVKPVLQQRDTAGGAARLGFQHIQAHICIWFSPLPVALKLQLGHPISEYLGDNKSLLSPQGRGARCTHAATGARQDGEALARMGGACF